MFSAIVLICQGASCQQVSIHRSQSSYQIGKREQKEEVQREDTAKLQTMKKLQNSASMERVYLKLGQSKKNLLLEEFLNKYDLEDPQLCLPNLRKIFFS